MFFYLLIYYLMSALAAFILGTLILATFGWSLGVRRLYVRVLLKIFKVKYKEKYNWFNVRGERWLGGQGQALKAPGRLGKGGGAGRLEGEILCWRWEGWLEV